MILLKLNEKVFHNNKNVYDLGSKVNVWNVIFHKIICK